MYSDGAWDERGRFVDCMFAVCDLHCFTSRLFFFSASVKTKFQIQNMVPYSCMYTAGRHYKSEQASAASYTTWASAVCSQLSISCIFQVKASYVSSRRLASGRDGELIITPALNLAFHADSKLAVACGCILFY